MAIASDLTPEQTSYEVLVREYHRMDPDHQLNILAEWFPLVLSDEEGAIFSGTGNCIMVIDD